MARNETKPSSFIVKILALVLALLLPSIAILFLASPVLAQVSIPLPLPLPWAAGLPVYDHVLIVVEENKDYEQIIGNKKASYINDVLRKEGANLSKSYAEEHFSEGNYFWLFSGSNQHVGFTDKIPSHDLTTGNLGEGLIHAGRSFKGYSEGLPEIGSMVAEQGLYARKHVPWVSFSNVPRGKTVDDSSNLRFPQDFPSDYNALPTVSFVIPNLANDMHSGSIQSGDQWLRQHIDGYYRWAKQHNSLLILTFDENSQFTLTGGVTDPGDKNPRKANHIVTIFAGAHIKPGDYEEGKGVTHVNVLRTLEAMYKLSRSGSQHFNALKAGIADDYLIKDIFDVTP